MFDKPIEMIVDYVCNFHVKSEEAYTTATYCLADSIGCAILALQFKECTKLLGPVVSGTTVPNGCRVPGTSYVLDPILGAFNIGSMIRWLDYNDTWLAAEWGHPSDNLGAILAVTDYLSRSGKNIVIRDILTAMIKAYEIQGGIALLNSFNRVGFDHVILVKIASAGVIANLLGGNILQVANAVSNAFADAGPLRTYRHEPNTGSRKSWAAGDATSRGVMFAYMVMKGEMGYPSVLTAKKWGMYDVLFQGKPFTFQRPFESYVMENILFKISFPAEFHAQTAVEAGLKLHPKLKDKIEKIERIEITTHDAAIRIIDKKGKLNNPADRDHCLQYMVAIALLYGDLTAHHYEDDVAKDERIDRLRNKMVVTEDKQFSLDYHDPEKRSIANAVQIFFDDGTSSDKIVVEYPLGHRRRRQESVPYLFQKLEKNLSTHYSKDKVSKLLSIFKDKSFVEMPVKDFMGELVVVQ